MASRSRLIRLILGELEMVMASENARRILRAQIQAQPDADAEALLAMADGPLRVVLQNQLGNVIGDAAADRICGALMAHVASGIRRRTPPAPLTIGVVHVTRTTPTQRLIAGIVSIGCRAVVLHADDLDTKPSAEFLDVFLVTSDLTLADARHFAWIASTREPPTPVMVWPIAGVRPEWGKAIPGAIYLEHASFALLQKALHDLVVERVEARSAETAG